MRIRRFATTFAVSALLTAIVFAGCGRTPKTFDSGAPRVVHVTETARRAKPVPSPADIRRWNRALWIHAYEDMLERIFEAAHPAPPPVSGHRCAGLVGYVIQARFGWAADWAQSIAWRESNCQPDAYNRAGSKGLFQLNGHDDILATVCVEADPALSWKDAGCNTAAAWELFLEAGPGPWRL